VPIKLKVGFLNQPWDYGAPPNPGGAIGLWTWEVSRRLAGVCDVLVFGPKTRDQPSSERWAGVQFLRVPLTADLRIMAAAQRLWYFRNPPRSGMASNLYYRIYAMRAARAFRTHGCDVVHIHNLSQFVPVVRRLNPRVRIVLEMQSNWLVQLDRDVVEARITDANAIVGCSESVTEAVRRRFPNQARRYTTVFNGVDTRAFRPLDQEPSATQSNHVVYLGRLSPEKGVHVLIDAFEQVVARQPCARLEIIGGVWAAPREFIVDLDDSPIVRRLSRFYGGESYYDFLQRRLLNGLGKSVSFAGELCHEELSRRLPGAAMLVAPSLVETFGMPVIEAMASGLPVIASRIGGLPELIEDGTTGILVDPDCPDALAGSIVRLLNDRELAHAMGAAGRLRAEQMFDWDKTAEKLYSLYQALC
jgi:glycosyltransferase involved in cell wall biosynthesis